MQGSSTQWRYVPPLAVSGTWQMAIDAWLLAAHRAGAQPPCLRFYTWEPAAISLGYHQKHFPEAWKSLGLDLVRRPSGGRAVLHQGDLTYTVVTSGLSPKRIVAYRQICEVLISGWRSLGIPLQYGHVGRDYARQANCFELATGADLVMDTGEKLIGSAQLRQGEAILQHGSMRLDPDPALYARAFGTELPERSRSRPPQAEIIEALCRAVCACLGIQLVEQPLTAAEWDEIGRLRDRYEVG